MANNCNRTLRIYNRRYEEKDCSGQEMLSPSQLVLLLVGSATLGIAAPAPFTQSPFAVSQLHFDVLEMRTRMPLNPKALLDVQCLDRRKYVANAQIHI